jgi:hypothetical protein
MKGHSYGNIPCKKCGKTHEHPRGALGKTLNFRNPEERNWKIGQGNKGKVFSTEHKEKLSLARKGTKLTEEERRKIKESVSATFGKYSEMEKSQKFGNFGDKNPMKRLDIRLKHCRQNPKKGHWGHTNPAKRLSVKKKLSLIARNRFKNESWLLKHIIVMRDSGFGFSSESRKHIALKEKAKLILMQHGFTTSLEYPVLVRKKWYIVDVVGLKNCSIAVECGKCEDKKLKDLESVFDEVWHIPYDANIDTTMPEVIKVD